MHAQTDRRIAIVDGMIFGRSQGAQTFPDDGAVSSKHFKLSLSKKGEVFIEDLNSRNSTMVNGTKLAPGKPQKLKANDVIAIGGQTFTVTDQEAEDPNRIQLVQPSRIPAASRPAARRAPAGSSRWATLLLAALGLVTITVMLYKISTALALRQQALTLQNAAHVSLTWLVSFAVFTFLHLKASRRLGLPAYAQIFVIPVFYAAFVASALGLNALLRSRGWGPGAAAPAAPAAPATVGIANFLVRSPRLLVPGRFMQNGTARDEKSVDIRKPFCAMATRAGGPPSKEGERIKADVYYKVGRTGTGAQALPFSQFAFIPSPPAVEITQVDCYLPWREPGKLPFGSGKDIETVFNAAFGQTLRMERLELR